MCNYLNLFIYLFMRVKKSHEDRVVNLLPLLDGHHDNDILARFAVGPRAGNYGFSFLEFSRRAVESAKRFTSGLAHW